MKFESGARRAVFLDRDGVLNAVVERDGQRMAPRHVADFHVLPGAPEAVDRLRALGYLALVVSNQPDVARGLLQHEELDRMTVRMREAVAVDDVAVCTHDDDDGCNCRKPRPGMLTDLAARWGVDLSRSFMVGDSWRDVAAGRSVGCQVVFIMTGATSPLGVDIVVRSLEEAASVIERLASTQCLGGGVTFARRFLDQAATIAGRLDADAVERMAVLLAEIRARGGRLFFLGVGGGAGHSSHAVNDFRKLAGMECYAPTDNVSELTARINDEGWDGVLSSWLRGSRLGPKDGVFVFSVGGGSVEPRVSANIVGAVELAREVGATVLGVVGRDGGHTARRGDAVVVIPTVDDGLVTPHTEAFQAVVWHLLVSHPALNVQLTRWESLAPPGGRV